jgi:hypothetical protein
MSIDPRPLNRIADDLEWSVQRVAALSADICASRTADLGTSHAAWRRVVDACRRLDELIPLMPHVPDFVVHELAQLVAERLDVAAMPPSAERASDN